MALLSHAVMALYGSGTLVGVGADASANEGQWPTYTELCVSLNVQR